MDMLSRNFFGRVLIWMVRFTSSWIPFLATRIRSLAQTFAGKGLEAYVTGDLTSAETYYREAMQWLPHDADLHSAFGQVFYRQGSLGKAEEQFRKALLYDYRNLRALKGLGAVLQETGELQEAMYVYLKYLEIEPLNADVCLNLAVVLHQLGNFDLALDYYNQAGKLDPREVLIYKNRAITLSAMGRYDAAEASLLKASELAPDDGSLDSLLGAVFSLRGEPDKALERYDSAIKKDAKNADAYLKSCRILESRKEYREAANRAQTAADLYLKAGDSHSSARAYWELGWVHYRLGQLSESERDSVQALVLDSTLVPVYFNLGLTLLHMGRAREARQRYEEGVKRLRQIDDLKTHAIEDLQEALSKNPQLSGASEILEMLEKRYKAYSDDLRESVRQSSAGSSVR